MSYADTTLKIPWVSGSTSIGHGYSAFESQYLLSPFEPFEVRVEDAEPEVNYEHITISSEEDLRREIGNTLDISASVFGIGIQTSFNQLQNLSSSSKSMTVILRCTISHPPSMYGSKPILTHSAEALLNSDPARFQVIHGSHFVAGYIKKSTISAVFVFEASSKEQLDEFKGSAKIGKGPFSADLASKYKEEADKQNVSCTITWTTSGIAATHLSLNPTPEDVKAIFVSLPKHRPSPQIALLNHYCLVDHRILREVGVAMLSNDIRNGVMASLQIANTAKNSTLYGMAFLQNEAVEVGQQFSRLQPTASNYEQELVRPQQDLRQVQQQLELWKARERLLNAAEQTQKPSDTYQEVGYTRNFDYGLVQLDSSLPSPIRDEIKHTNPEDWGNCRMHGNGLTQAKTVNAAPYNAYILGFRVTSRWDNDGSNGPYKIVDGGVNSDHVNVRFKTKNCTGGDWGVQVYYVDRELYRKRES